MDSRRIIILFALLSEYSGMKTLRRIATPQVHKLSCCTVLKNMIYTVLHLSIIRNPFSFCFLEYNKELKQADHRIYTTDM